MERGFLANGAVVCWRVPNSASVPEVERCRSAGNPSWLAFLLDEIRCGRHLSAVEWGISGDDSWPKTNKPPRFRDGLVETSLWGNYARARRRNAT